MLKKIKIVSDGTARGTQFLDHNCEPLALGLVTKLAILVEPGGLVKATIEIQNLDLDVTAQAEVVAA